MTRIFSGKPITREEAHRHFRMFIQIKQRATPLIKEKLVDDVEAKRYYCGKCLPVSVPIHEDLAFVFHRDSIQQILTALNSHLADGIIIFHGVRSQEDSRIGTTNTFDDVDGRPTVMIFPYKASGTVSQLTGDPDLEVDLDKGAEHPGTGGRAPEQGTAADPYQVPSTFRADEIQAIYFDSTKPLIE